MLVPTHQRTDNTVPVITLGLDGRTTDKKKKFKCAMCGGTVFAYWDTLRFELPLDFEGLNDRDLFKSAQPLDEIECTHWTFNSYGKRVRCQAHYITLRGAYEVTGNG